MSMRAGGREEGREGGKDGPFNQHTVTHALACLHYGYGCEPRLREDIKGAHARIPYTIRYTTN